MATMKDEVCSLPSRGVKVKHPPPPGVSSSHAHGEELPGSPAVEEPLFSSVNRNNADAAAHRHLPAAASLG